MRVTPDDTAGSPQIQGDGHSVGHSVDQTGAASRLETPWPYGGAIWEGIEIIEG